MDRQRLFWLPRFIVSSSWLFEDTDGRQENVRRKDTRPNYSVEEDNSLADFVDIMNVNLIFTSIHPTGSRQLPAIHVWLVHVAVELCHHNFSEDRMVGRKGIKVIWFPQGIYCLHRTGRETGLQAQNSFIVHHCTWITMDLIRVESDMNVIDTKLVWTMLLILYGNSKYVAHAWRKIDFFGQRLSDLWLLSI